MHLLSAAETGDVATIKRLLHTRYIDVDTTDPVVSLCIFCSIVLEMYLWIIA